MLFRSKPEIQAVPTKWFPTHAGEVLSPRAAVERTQRSRSAAKPRITTSNVSEDLAKVLIADPEQAGRAHAVRVLGDHRVQFSVAPDAAMVLRLLELNRYAVCVIDAAVLANSGNLTNSIAKTLARARQRVVIIVTSKTGSAGDRRLAHSIHALEFLVKPLARDQIHLIVERTLALF